MADEIDDAGVAVEPAKKHTGGWTKGKPRGPRTASLRSEETHPEPRTRRRKGGTLQDKYAIPDGLIPDGQSWEWKSESVLGMGNLQYDVMLREQGWLPVDGALYPELVGTGHKGPVRRDGLILMERPIELTREAMEEDRMAARAAVAAKEEQLGQAPKGQFQRHRADGSSTIAINKTVERGMPIE